MRLLFYAVLWAALVGAASPTSSPLTSAVQIERTRLDSMLRTGHADAAWFSDSFLSQIPATEVDRVIASVTTALGAYQSLEIGSDQFVAHFLKGTDVVLIHLDTDDKIDGLLFKPPHPIVGPTPP
ncbi:MAG: hypothetical protein JOZ77_11525 [Candidatus Eremiobacteraeota bacterium]|nr:hypothetical protein [Candidatus Eremiobacteraeota bacterium]